MVTVSRSVLMSVFLSVSVLQGTLTPVTSFRLRILPRHDHRQLNERVKIMCKVDEPITSCEFRSFYKSHYDLSAGVLTEPQQSYRYYGNGLENGECGIDMAPYRRTCHDIVECRVRTESHGWKYASAMIEVNDDASKPTYHVAPHHAYVESGTNISVLGHSDGPLRSCSYKWIDNSWIHFDQTTHLEVPEADRNLGKGLDNGDCAVILPRVTDSGFVIFLAFRKSGPRDTSMSHMTAMVYKGPDPPELSLDKENYATDHVLTATCEIKNSRPVANISWYFDGELLRSDTVDETTDDTRWRWSYNLHNIKQSVTRKLTWEDDGKEVSCRAGHVALPGGEVNASKRIVVYYSPRYVSRPVEVSGFRIGEDGVVTCRYVANPPPTIEWKFEQTKPGSAVAAGRYNSTEVVKEGDYYVSTMTIHQLTYSDEGQGLVIRVHNTQGGFIHFLKFNIQIFDYDSFDRYIGDYDYSSLEIIGGFSQPNIVSQNMTTSTIPPTPPPTTPTPTTPTTTPTPTTPTTTPTTPTATSKTTTSVSSTAITSPTTVNVTSSTTTTTTTAVVTTEATTNRDIATELGVVLSTEEMVPKSEPHGTASKIGLAFGIISLIVVVVGISFFVYRRSTRNCFNRLQYAHFRRTGLDDGADETFNINTDLDIKV